MMPNNQAQPLSRTWYVRLSTILGLLIVFAALAEDVWFKETFAWDAPVALAIHQFRRPWLDLAMRAITQTGKLGALAFVIGLTLWFVWRQQFHAAVTYAISYGGALALDTLLKLWFARPRPQLFPPLVTETGSSFPSGHTITAVAVYGLLAVWLWRYRSPGWALVAGGWVVIVALSRVYLGVHYPSDVLAAGVLGVLWLFALLAVSDKYARHLHYPLSEPSEPAEKPPSFRS